MDNPDLPYWLALKRFPAFGAKRMKQLRLAFPSMKEAFFSSASDLQRAGITEKCATQFIEARNSISPQAEFEETQKHGVSIVTILDDAYPRLLKEIHDPPELLFVRGKLPPEDSLCFAVVGSRKATGYSQQIIHQLVEPLARNGVVIVSGLAYGVDTLAAECALRAGAKTIAVLGTGVDDASIYPRRNLPLANRIISSGGAIISEFPLGTESFPHHFPLRNRIIAGLSRGTLITEAAQKSGSLITTRSALESGRDVFAVPGPITSPLSEGPNSLIKIGAIPATCPEDLYEHLGLVAKESEDTAAPENDEEAELFTLLSQEPLHLDELIRRSGKPTADVSSILTIMEMKGSARHLGGLFYVRG